ncbi:MAG: dienelactone hydrolase family protein [Deltaproteobacteria bacterium]|nr:dienelactone hydrolase family protein [Deltaproteobacteria bacterium]MCW5808221.1 dienelactone hydrolase family protein [Deltaproteobacteria bacterium]
MRLAVEPHGVTVRAGSVALLGDLYLPPGAVGLVAFAHGAGSGRTSPRDRAVAQALASAGLASLLFDLLTREEALEDRHTAELRFDVPLLADRLLGAIEWTRRQEALARLPVGLFGASSGAAAALTVAGRAEIAAVVTRGGRPDLAGPALGTVRCPTLLVVGARDAAGIGLHRRAMHQMTTLASLYVVPDAGHLFEEPGALREVIDAASEWYRLHLAATRREEAAVELV